MNLPAVCLDSNAHPMIVIERTDKHWRVIALEDTIKIRRIPVEFWSDNLRRFLPEIMRQAYHKNEVYPLRKARAHFRRIAKEPGRGITDGALAALRLL